MRKIFYWLPRILGILLVLYMSLFALDVFSENYNFSEMIIALLMHLIPAFILVFVLFVAWLRENLGALLYILLAGLYIFLTRQNFEQNFEIISWLFISGPLFLIGVLFLFDGLMDKRRYV